MGCSLADIEIVSMGAIAKSIIGGAAGLQVRYYDFCEAAVSQGCTSQIQKQGRQS
jgi:hypothetical protein